MSVARPVAHVLTLALSIQDAQAVTVTSYGGETSARATLSVDVDEAALPLDLPYYTIVPTVQLYGSSFVAGGTALRYSTAQVDGYEHSTLDHLALGYLGAFYRIDAYPASQWVLWEINLSAVLAAT